MRATNLTLVFGLMALLSACGSSNSIVSGTYQSGVDGVEPVLFSEPVELLLVYAENMHVLLQVDGKTVREFSAEATGEWAEGCQTNFTADKMERWRLHDKATPSSESVFLHAACGGPGVVISTNTKTVLFGTPE